jgi:hypothetical protein
VQVTPWLEHRLRLAVSAARAVPSAADDAAAARLTAALAEVPRPVLSRMLAVADLDDEQGAAALVADPELLATVEGLVRAVGALDGDG